MTKIESVPWPDELEWIIQRLKATQFQEFTEITTDSGDVMRRPKSSPLPAYADSIEMPEATYKNLLSFIQKSKSIFYKITTPDTRKSVIATLTKNFHLEKTSITVGGPKTVTLYVELAVVA